MYLDAVSALSNTNINSSAKPVAAAEKIAVFDQWKDWHPSQISHHGKLCCEISREWITSTDFSALNGDCKFTGPRWLRQKFRWGASSFPIHWCEAVRRDTLDCGALAALAFEVFRARGVKTYRAQFVQKFSEVSTSQWTNSWSENCAPLPWVNGELIYHEGCAIETEDGKIKAWDASAGWWVDPKPAKGYGSLLALRLSGFNLPAGKTFAWGSYTVRANEWMEIS